MSRTHIGQEGAQDEKLIAQVVPATLTRGFYAYVVTNGAHRYISGPHADRAAAQRDADDWIAAEIKRRGLQRRAQLERLKLHAGEHPAFGAQPVAELDCPPTEDAPPVEIAITPARRQTP